MDGRAWGVHNTSYHVLHTRQERMDHNGPSKGKQGHCLGCVLLDMLRGSCCSRRPVRLPPTWETPLHPAMVGQGLCEPPHTGAPHAQAAIQEQEREAAALAELDSLGRFEAVTTQCGTAC